MLERPEVTSASKPDYDGFFAYVSTVKDQFLKKLEHEKAMVFVVTHHDADGISAGAIMACTLIRQQIPFQVRVADLLD